MIDNACSRCGAPLADGCDPGQLAAHATWRDGRAYCGAACAELAVRGIPATAEFGLKGHGPTAQDLVGGGTVKVTHDRP